MDGTGLQDKELGRGGGRFPWWCQEDSFQGPCISGGHVSHGCGWVDSKYWPHIWEAAGGTKAGLDTGNYPPVPAPEGGQLYIYSSLVTLCVGVEVVKGGMPWQERGQLANSCALVVLPSWVLSIAWLPLCVVSGKALRTRWRKQTFVLSPRASSM